MAAYTYKTKGLQVLANDRLRCCYHAARAIIENRNVRLTGDDLEMLLDNEGKKKITPRLESIKGWLEQIHNLRQCLEPQTPAKRGRATTFNVRDEIEDNFRLYEALLQNQGIRYEIIAPQTPARVKMSRACLGQIVANMIDNGIAKKAETYLNRLKQRTKIKK